MPHPYGNTEHLWIVVAAAGDEVAIVNLNTHRRGADETVVFEGGEHPFIKHKTVVTYADGRICKRASINAYAEKMASWQSPFSNDLLARMQAGAVDSPFTPLKIVRFVREAIS